VCFSPISHGGQAIMDKHIEKDKKYILYAKMNFIQHDYFSSLVIGQDVQRNRKSNTTYIKGR
jgi:hypothetical protein